MNRSGLLYQWDHQQEPDQLDYLYCKLATKRRRNGAIWVYPFCEMPQNQEFDECPQCGIIVSKYLVKLEMTRSGVAEAIEKQPVAETAAIPKQNFFNKTTVAIPSLVWEQLEALGGDPREHLNRALSTYLLRARASQYGRRGRLSLQ
jgi:hypothetical protein